MRGIRRRLEAAAARAGAHASVCLWDVIAGAVPLPADLDQLDPPSRKMLDELARLPEEIPDRVSQRTVAMLGETTP